MGGKDRCRQGKIKMGKRAVGRVVENEGKDGCTQEEMGKRGVDGE